MFAKGAIASLLLAGGAAAQPFQCPETWNYIARDLKHAFTQDHGCNSYGRQAVRLPFHDCFPGGGCDGSIILSDECVNRPENARLVPICALLRDVANKYRVGVADLINLAAAIGTKSCRWGPYTPFYVGRSDNASAAAVGQVPSPNLQAQPLIDLFTKRGFTPDDLVALVGSHSAGHSATNVPFDSTPTALDSWTYYTETRDLKAPISIPSDVFLSQYGLTRDAWNVYSVSQEAWDKDFVTAWKKLITLDNTPTQLFDCTEVVFKAFPWGEYGS